ncbi:MAG: thiolase family protein, partial [Desulfomonilaceae bacterium]
LCVQSINAGQAEIAIASGAESMGNTALLAAASQVRWGNRLGPVQLEDVLFELGYSSTGFAPVARDAGEVALEFGISRSLQDEWALMSQSRWQEAYRAGRFKVGEEIMPLELPQKKGNSIVLDKDESPRPDTSLEKLAKLKPIYGSPTVTAGNAPGMNSGAAAIVVTTREKALEKGLMPLASVKSVACAAGEPRYMACVPAQAIQKILRNTGLSIDEMELVEINEAFAAVTLVSLKMLAGDDKDRQRRLAEKTNVNGGAIAIGHPVGASGARITMTLMYELRRRGGGLGVAAICGGLSQGEAVILEV